MKKILAACALFYAVLYLLYYPPIFAFSDESSYLSMAYVYRSGTIFPDQTDIPVDSFVQMPRHQVASYQPGTSWALIPLTFLGWRFVFLLGLISHLVGFYYFYRCLELFEIQPVFSLLYLFFPPFVFFSRTIMSDIPAATLFLIGCHDYFHPRGSKVRAGMWMGLSMLFRITQVVAALPFLVLAAFKSLKGKRDKGGLFLILGWGIFAVATALWNQLNYGSPFLVGRSSIFNGVRNFSWQYLVPNLRHYLPSLLLMYPLMLFAPFFAKRTRRPETIASALALFSCYALYYFHDTFPSRFGTLLLGTRFLFPLFPLLLLNYSEYLQMIFLKLSPSMRTALLSIGAYVLVAASLFLHHEHQAYLGRQLALRDAIYKSTAEHALLIYHFNAGELVQRTWGDRDYVRYEDATKTIADYQKKRPEQKAYLVDRAVVYAGEKTGGISEKHLASLRQFLKLKLIAETDGLKIFELKK